MNRLVYALLALVCVTASGEDSLRPLLSLQYTQPGSATQLSASARGGRPTGGKFVPPDYFAPTGNGGWGPVWVPRPPSSPKPTTSPKSSRGKADTAPKGQGGKSSASGSQSGPSQGGQSSGQTGKSKGLPHGPGFGVEFDIAGMEHLYQRMEAEKAYKEYLRWLSGIRSNFKTFFDQQPLTIEDLKKKGFEPTKLAPIMEQDKRHIQMFDQAGLPLIMLPAMDRATVSELFKEMNLDVSTGSKDEAWVYIDVYERFMAEEISYFNRLVQYGRTSAGELRERASKRVGELEGKISELARIKPRVENPPEQKSIIAPIPNEFREQSIRVEQKIERIDTASPQGTEFKSLARNAFNLANESAGKGAMPDARWYLNVAEGVADIALGIDPITGFYRSLLESVTGYNVVTFEKLSGMERGLAVLGLISGGTITSARQVIRLVSKLGAPTRYATQILNAAERTGKSIAKLGENVTKYLDWARGKLIGSERTRALDDLGRSLVRVMEDQGLEVKQILSADELNEMAIFKGRFPKDRINSLPPFQTWTHGFKVVTRNDEKFVRVYTEGVSHPVGHWIAREREIADVAHDANALQKRLSLPNTPTHISDVTIPRNTELYSGRVRSNFGGDEGAMQYLIPGPVNEDWFKSGRLIGR